MPANGQIDPHPAGPITEIRWWFSGPRFACNLFPWAYDSRWGHFYSRTSYSDATPSGVVFLKPFFPGIRGGEDLDVLVADLLAVVDLDPDCRRSALQIREADGCLRFSTFIQCADLPVR